MSALSARWGQWATKFAAISRRERAIVAGAVLFGGGLLIFSLGIDPFLIKVRSASRAEIAARTELVQQQAQLAALAVQSADPDAPGRRRLTQAKQDLAAASQRLGSFEAGMVPPARMAEFLQGLLAGHRAIELLGLKTLPVTLVGAQIAVQKSEAASGAVVQIAKDPAKDKVDADGAAPVTGGGIYQHGIEIKLAGSYNDLLNYLTELERMPQRVMWNSISLTVEKYPRNIMVLRVYTLSLDRSWLIV